MIRAITKSYTGFLPPCSPPLTRVRLAVEYFALLYLVFAVLANSVTPIPFLVALDAESVIFPRVLTTRAYGFHTPEALIATAMLTRGGCCPPLPCRNHPRNDRRASFLYIICSSL